MENIGVVGMDFIIDKLTKSIIEVSTGKSEMTLILPLNLKDLEGTIWQFDWVLEFDQQRHLLYK